MIQHLSFTFIPFATQLFSTPVTSLNLRNQAPLFTKLRLLQATHCIYCPRQRKLGSVLLQPLPWCCVDCVIHHEQDMRKE